MTTVVVTGPVGVGKTTVINKIVEKMGGRDVKVIKEYIDGLKSGEIMLEKYLRKEISAVTFQRYIMNYYATALTSSRSSEIVLMERCPDDAVCVFCKKDYMSGKLSLEEYNEIKHLSDVINTIHDIPDYSRESDSMFVSVRSDDAELCSTVCCSIINACSAKGVEKLIIGLYESPKVCYDRIIERNRNGEAEGYKFEDVCRINKYYEDLYISLLFK